MPTELSDGSIVPGTNRNPEFLHPASPSAIRKRGWLGWLVNLHDQRAALRASHHARNVKARMKNRKAKRTARTSP